MKQKTKQAARKRFTITASGKVRRRPIKQAHFNSRATGEEGRRKHGFGYIETPDYGRIEQLLPNDLK